ncbi:MAG: cadherin-like beta sandwich domain-containing protein [Treponemataceae bacterium]
MVKKNMIFIFAMSGILLSGCPEALSQLPKSNNADLASISVSPGTLSPNFAPNVTDYTVVIENDIDNITITGTASDPKATISGQSGQNVKLDEGTNKITITVTAEDGITSKNYVATINKESLHLITFHKNADAASGNMEPQYIGEGAGTSLPPNSFVYPGYNFAGWAVIPEGTVSYLNQAAFTMGTGDVNLYAVWLFDDSERVFVSLSGSDLSPGTKGSPKRSIQAGINLAVEKGWDVYISAGTYISGTIILYDGVSLYGGYNPNTWQYDGSEVSIYHTGNVIDTRIIGVKGNDLTSPTVLDSITIQTPDAEGNAVSNYALYDNNAPGLVVRACAITAGKGSKGADGSNGNSGSNGNNGINGTLGHASSEVAALGGSGGSSAIGKSGGSGGSGGYKSASGQAGSTGEVGISGGAGGASSGSPEDKNGDNGSNDSNGSAGVNGSGGYGGNLTSSYWSTSNGSSATNGAHGNGGGGGGGGGGGSGGQGGTAGTGGLGGGGSFGIFLVNSSGFLLIDSTVASSDGGAGGAGGSGGSGGIGGTGGAGANAASGQVGGGGAGGAGGNGGQGGHGGGGAGGPSFAVYRSNSTVTFSGSVLTHGSGGFGGSSEGLQGSTGAAANTFP